MISDLQDVEISSKNQQLSISNSFYDQSQEQDSSDECNSTHQQSQKTKCIQKKDPIQRRHLKQNVQMKKVLYGLNYVKQQNQKDQQQNDQNELLYKMISSQKLFFLLGDVYVELKDVDIENKIQFYNSSRNILFVERTAQGIQKEIESITNQKDYSSVIYYLENSQDKDHYDFAQYLKIQSSLLNQISQSIQEIQNFYLNGLNDLEDIIIQRNVYKQQYRKQLIEQYSIEDNFSCLITISLSFKKQAFTISNIFFSNSLMALLGADGDTSNEYFKKGIVNIYSSESRKQIMENYMKAQQQNVEQFEIALKNFELQTFDKIKIICEHKIKVIQICYPPHLQFQNFPLLNQKEKFIMDFYELDAQSIQNLLLMRESQFNDLSYSKIFPDNYHYYSEITTDEDLKCSLESQKFMKKYYEKEYNRIQQQNTQLSSSMNS